MKGKFEKKEALATLNRFLREEIKPVELDQVHSLDTSIFQKWLGQSSLKKTQKKKWARFLEPLTDASAIEGVILREATQVENGSGVDMAVIPVPEAMKSKLRDSDIIIIIIADGNGNGNGDDDDQSLFCSFSSCRSANPGNSLCVTTTTTRTGAECPEDKCSDNSDCGGTGDGKGNLDIVHQVLTAF